MADRDTNNHGFHDWSSYTVFSSRATTTVIPIVSSSWVMTQPLLAELDMRYVCSQGMLTVVHLQSLPVVGEMQWGHCSCTWLTVHFPYCEIVKTQNTYPNHASRIPHVQVWPDRWLQVTESLSMNPATTPTGKESGSWD